MLQLSVEEHAFNASRSRRSPWVLIDSQSDPVSEATPEKHRTFFQMTQVRFPAVPWQLTIVPLSLQFQGLQCPFLKVYKFWSASCSLPLRKQEAAGSIGEISKHCKQTAAESAVEEEHVFRTRKHTCSRQRGKTLQGRAQTWETKKWRGGGLLSLWKSPSPLI